MHARLRQDLDRWSAQGLITAEQAGAIAAYEAEANPQKSNFLAEGLGYVGAALALGASLLIAQRVWTGLPVAARLLLLGLCAVAFFGAGWLLRSRDEPPLRRLTDVLWSVAAVAAGAFAAEFAAEVAGMEDESIALAGGVTAMVAAAGLWAIRRHSLELVVGAVAAVVVTLSAVSLVAPDSSPLVAGFAIWLLGALLFGAGSFGLLYPKTTALVLGTLGVLIGSRVLTVEANTAPAVVAVVSAALLVVYAIRGRNNAILAMGSIGLLIFVPQLVFVLFGETLGGPVALFATGIALVAVAVSLVRRRSADHRTGTGDPPGESGEVEPPTRRRRGPQS